MDRRQPVIELRGVHKTYGRGGEDEIRALAGIDLVLPAGETYGLIGPNGAGKTTLLKIIATLLPPTQGVIRVAGYDTESQRLEVCRRLGFMPELFSLYEEMRVWEYLEFFAGCYGLPVAGRPKTIEDVMELTDLAVRRNSFCGTLSKGMRQRLLLAKTLVNDPDVLLLDEPTSGMDPQARIEFRNVLKTLARMGKTTIISSHILTDLATVCSSVGIMEKGVLRASGTIEELQTQLQVQRVLEIGFLGTGQDPLPILRERKGISQARLVQPGKVSCALEGGLERRAELLAELVRRGVLVTDFRERSTDLEEIFLQVGATEVQ